MCATNQQFDCHTSPLKVQDVLSDDDLHRLHCLVDKNESLSETLVLLDSLVEKPAINDEECNCLIQALEKIQCYTDQPIDITIKANLNISLPNIPTDARWNQLGVNIAGSKWKDNETAQRKSPRSLFIDEDQTVIIADMNNDRIIQYKVGDENGQIIAGGNGRGNQTNQLNRPSDVLVDSITNSLIICDRWNKRIIRWPRYTDTKQGEILLINIHCWGLAIDDQRYLYISDTKHHEIRRYRIGETKGIIAAGGHKSGTGLHQLNRPTYLFIDLYKNIYISDSRNQRVMKWMENATEGIIIAASTLEQRILPRGLFVDALETLYMVDAENHRIMRWPKESLSQGTRNYREVNSSLEYPWDLSFDQYCNLYITDLYSFQIQRFSYEYIYQKI